ncbi:MAG: P-type conjugative transfer protein TrbJ [Hyphomicrobiales bacterium]|nr:P-type conjugative transfer protein TrbJ [Hyphomicrobiales bacterium]
MKRAQRIVTVACSVAVAAIIAATDARGLTVFDPINYQQNLLTAARSLESIQNQVRQLQNQADQLLRMNINLRPLSGGIGTDLQSTLAQLRARISEGDALALRVRETDAAFDRLYPRTFADTVRSDELLRAARSRWEEAHAGFRRAALLQGQVSEAIDGDGRLLDRVLVRSQGAVGALQVAQAGNELSALNVKQALQLQALLAAQQRADTTERLRGMVAEEEARQRFRTFVGNGRAYARGR